MKIIDCTIRDGGHCNKWKFEPQFVRDAFIAANKAKIDYFEMGYRMPLGMPGLGAFGYCDDTFIADLVADVEGPTKLIVMVDTGKVNITDFEFASESPFYGVRVAAYPHELPEAMKQAEYLLEHGYKVWLNPMVTIKLSKNHIELIQNWEHLKDVEAVYIADSFGSFLPGDASDIISTFRSFEIPKLGFHAHNNLNLAVANTLEAISEGVAFADVTIHAMGRGAGNAAAEIITGIVPGYDPLPYLDFIQKKAEWKYDAGHVLGGLHGVHPYYTEKIIDMASCTDAATVFNKNILPTIFDLSALVEAMK